MSHRIRPLFKARLLEAEKAHIESDIVTTDEYLDKSIDPSDRQKIINDGVKPLEIPTGARKRMATAFRRAQCHISPYQQEPLNRISGSS
eukprot:542234-Hanusia_phi.AAC.1